MLRIQKMILTLILLASSGVAISAALEIREYTVEAAVGDLTLPAHTAGQVVHRECNGCDPSIWPVNAETEYFIGFNSLPVTLDQLRAELARRDQQDLVVVFHAPDSGAVTRIVLP